MPFEILLFLTHSLYFHHSIKNYLPCHLLINVFLLQARRLLSICKVRENVAFIELISCVILRKVNTCVYIKREEETFFLLILVSERKGNDVVKFDGVVIT